MKATQHFLKVGGKQIEIIALNDAGRTRVIALIEEENDVGVELVRWIMAEVQSIYPNTGPTIEFAVRYTEEAT